MQIMQKLVMLKKYSVMIEGYEEDKIYESGEISLTMMNSNQKPDNVFYRRLKEKSVYASFDDIVKFAC